MLFDKRRYLDKNINKIGIVDIETGGQGFNANTSFVIAWAIKIIDLKKNTTKTIYDILNKKTIDYWDKKLTANKKLRELLPYDTELLKGLTQEIKKCDMIIGHYSDYFDIPIIRTRSMMLKLPFVKYTDHIRFGDTWKKARFGMKFIRNSVDVIGRSLGINIHKTRFSVWVWNQAAFKGKKWALDLIKDHNIKDVDIQYKIWAYCESNFNIPVKYY